MVTYHTQFLVTKPLPRNLECDAQILGLAGQDAIIKYQICLYFLYLLQTHKDVYLAILHKLKESFLSNQGRATDPAPHVSYTLLEICKYYPEVLQTVEVLVDVGIRLGTDVVKAIYPGLRRVGIGRIALLVLGAGWSCGR